MATPALRPLAVGEVLDVAIKITFRHVRTLALVVLIVVAPAQILSAAISVSQPDAFLDVEGGSVPSDQDVATTIASVSAVILLALLSSTLATGACFKAIVDAYLGSKPDWRSSLGFAARRLHSLLWISFLTYFLGAVALLGVVVLGVWLFVSWAVAVPAMLTEDVRGLKAMRRSFRLVRGTWWRTFGIFLLGFILAGVLSSVVQGVVAGLSFAADSTAAEFVLTSLGGIVGALISTPFTAAFITVLYVDLRVRKEGFDLQLLAERLGSGGPPAAPSEFLPPPPPARPAPGEEQPPFWPPPPGWKPRSESTEP